MKCKLLSSLALALLAWAAPARATSDFYVNDAVVLCPPQIPPQVDATNFVNNNYFGINFTNFVLNPQIYQTANTLNFTNTGAIVGNSGFQFDTGSLGGARRPAANFINPGTITAGSVSNSSNFAFNFFGLFFGQTGLPRILISATNVSMNSGAAVVGVNGLISVKGKNVDLTRANLGIEGFNDSSPLTTFSNIFFFNNFNTVGIYDAYWGISTNVMNPFFQFEVGTPTSPSSQVTTPGGGFGFQSLSLPGATAYARETFIGTNRTVQVVFLSNTNLAISNNVYFPNLGEAAVEWIAPQTNLATGLVYNNYLYLLDTFGSFGSNRLVQGNSILATQPTFIPANYSFIRGGPFPLGTPAPSGLTPNTFDSVFVTNQYAAYGAILAPTTQLPGTVPGGVITNLPGRIEIVADTVLDLFRAKINGLNYVRLQATNHFAGSIRAQISTPFADFNLGSTNGSLTISNLISPTVPRFTGTVDLWSGRWTNSANGFNNTYSVLFVDSKISPTAPAYLQDLMLRSTNVTGGTSRVIVSDVLNVLRTLLIDAERLTITTNEPGSVTPAGAINLLSSAITWHGSAPRLQYFTNNGSFTSQNAVFFGGLRTTPFFTSNYNEPYIAFVNSGTVATEGTLVWANYFENSGFFGSGLGFGSFTLQSQNAVLTNNGSIVALHGDISLTSSNLYVTNHILLSGRALNLSVTNLLTDTGASNANAWVVGNGMNLLVKPATGDLLGTVIMDTAVPGAEAKHLWAAQDRGCNSSGFLNDAALGKLILNGGFDSQFTFTGTGTSNAVYVDCLELRNYATNINNFGNLEAVQIDPNMKIYYAQALMNGVSVAERLNHANGDRLCWVAAYAGTYSSTNIVYPDGTTNTFNAALVQSCDLDSDGDLLPNCIDPTPIFRSQDLALTITVTNRPPPSAKLTWQSIPYSTNSVFYLTSLSATNWQSLTNVVLGPVGGTVTVFDPVVPSGRYYRVQMAVPQP